jgi:hypothetical protein
LQQGIDEKIFKLSYPEELTEILLMGVRSYMHIHLPKFKDIDYAKTKIAALEELFNKVLGIDKNYEIRLM